MARTESKEFVLLAGFDDSDNDDIFMCVYILHLNNGKKWRKINLFKRCIASLNSEFSFS